MNMRCQFNRLIWMVSLSAVLLSGCASTRSATDGAMGESTGNAPKVTDVSFKDTENKTVVTIATEGIPSYASYRLDNPPRLVVDLQGVASGSVQKPVQVNQGVVTNIVPSAPKPDKTRLEIGLSQQVDFNVVKKGNSLVVEVDKPVLSTEAPASASAQAMKETDQVQAVISAAEGSGNNKKAVVESMASASVVTDVKVETGIAGTRVVIKGNGHINAEAILLENEQLVVDVQEVKNAVFPNSFATDDPLIKRIRIGQFAEPVKKVRVAFELRTNVAYQLTKDGDKVVLALQKEAPASTGEADKSADVVKSGEPGKSVEESGQTEGGYSGRRISLDFQEADLKSVLRLIAEVSNLNLILAPDVKGTVSVKMLNVPWDQALDLILKINGLGQVRDGNILRVMTMAALTKEEQDTITRKEAQKKVEDTVSKIISINYAKAKDLADSLKKSLSSRGEITVEDRTNTLIVKDVPSNVQDIVTLIKILDKQTPQVMIEARIVEASTDFSRELGVQWGANYAGANRDRAWQVGVAGTKKDNDPDTDVDVMTGIGPMGSAFAVNLPAAVKQGAGGALGIGFSKLTGDLVDIDLNLSALESAGKGKIISSPKVMALDNKEATIKQGSSIPYATVSASGTSTTWVDAALELNVTPHVTPDNSVIMKIKASKNAPGTTTAAGPIINKKEAQTEILIRDGETVVIGGIYEVNKSDSEDGVPLLSKIPVLGWLFKKQSVVDTKRELLIFLTPKIVNPSN